MRSNLAQALAYVDGDEGSAINMSASEPGGSSKHGVSMTVLQEWHAQHNLPPPTMDDMLAVDAKLAGEIYAARFATPIRFDDLPSGVDYRLLDIAISAGVSGGIKIFQRTVGLPETGRMTAGAIAAARAADPAKLIDDLGTAWLTHKIQVSTPENAKAYTKGWNNRRIKANKRALALLEPVAPPKPVPAAPAPPPKPAPPVAAAPAAPPPAPRNATAMEVRNHRVYRSGSPIPYKQTPNGGGALAPVGIICHDTAGDLPGTGSISWLTNPEAKASAHFVVGYDGSLTQLQALNRQTWHAGVSQYKGRQGCNGFTIGIEIANPGAMVKYNGGYSNGGANPAKGVKIPAKMDVREASSPNHGKAFWLAYSEAQIATVTELCKAIKAAYPIEFVSTHWEICIPKGRKVDTNPLFPLAALRKAVFGAAAKKEITGVVNAADGLTVRAGASASSEMVTSLKKGTPVTITGTVMNGATKWYQIAGGFVAARYVTLDN